MNKRKSKNLPQQEENRIVNQLCSHPLVLWVSENGLKCVFGLLTFAILFFLLFRSNDQPSQIDNPSTKILQLLDEGKQLGHLNIAAINESFSRSPNLRPAYSGHLTQALLSLDHSNKAQSYLHESLARNKQRIPFMKEWATITVLITESSFEKALNGCQKLQSQLIQHKENQPNHADTIDLLFAMNLLRTGMLQQKLNLQEEKKTWEYWKQFANYSGKDAPFSPRAFQKASSLFEEKNYSLNQFIDMRLEKLNS